MSTEIKDSVVADRLLPLASVLATLAQKHHLPIGVRLLFSFRIIKRRFLFHLCILKLRILILLHMIKVQLRLSTDRLINVAFGILLVSFMALVFATWRLRGSWKALVRVTIGGVWR